MTTRGRLAAAAGMTGFVFLLYLLTLSPSVAMWDAGEYIAAARSLGIPHQPSNPMFVLIAHAAGLLPFADAYAMRINLLAAFCSALAAGFWFLCAEIVLRTKIERTAERLAASAAATLLEVLAAQRGLVCAVGAGGKKTTLFRLVEAHLAAGTARIGLACTVTMAPPPAWLGQAVIAEEAQLRSALDRLGPDRRLVVYAAPSAKPGRVGGVPPAVAVATVAHPAI